MKRYSQGFTLVMLMVFIAVSVTIASTAVLVLITTSRATTDLERGTIALDGAESGIENALIRLDADPGYTGETLLVGANTVTITVTGSSPYVVRSESLNGAFKRVLEVEAEESAGALTVSQWRELP